MAVVPMPKTTIDKDYSSVLREHKIWLARETLVVEDVAEAPRMQASPDDHLRFRVLAADT
jgi:hypothetical protein